MIGWILVMFASYGFAASLGIQERWSSISDPLIMGSSFETRFYALPLKGQVKNQTRFWSGDYWALNKGNIDRRWNARGSMLNVAPPNRSQLKQMSQDEIAQLSPAEKMDLLNGLYHYPLKAEVKKISDPGAQSWEGICHGWAPASMNHNEPVPKTLVNPDGVAIPFGSSDIKAILSYFYAYPYYVENTRQVGRRCYGGRTNPDQDCKQDLNAGAFHIVLANKISLENTGFIADMDRWQQVWNHPIMGYETKVLDEQRGGRSGAAPGTIRTLRVRTVISYVDETGNSWERVRAKIETKTLEYFLELNTQGLIIGGEWRYLARPDFLWLKESPVVYTGIFYRLKELLND
jgi:hypothetical protein